MVNFETLLEPNSTRNTLIFEATLQFIRFVPFQVQTACWPRQSDNY